MRDRLLDVNPHLQVVAESNGVTLDNVGALVRQSDIVVDMIDYHGIHEKVALYREARRQGKFVVTAPSIVNGGMLYVFHPEGITWERFFDFHEDLPIPELGLRMLRRLIPRFPSEAPESLYRAAARGERTIPLDAVGVDQAAVLAVAAIENLVLDRLDRLVFAPRGILVDASDPTFLAKVVDFGADFAEATC
jgi:molybdopterin/thiamine biosynthesis adenylyltransferase